MTARAYLLIAGAALWAVSLIYVGVAGERRGAALERAVWQQRLHAAESADRIKEQGWINTLEEARNAAQKRETENRRAADAARAAAGSLRVTIDALRARLAATPGAQPAAAGLDLLARCADEYRSLAEIADRHANDARTLTEAWPTEERTPQ